MIHSDPSNGNTPPAPQLAEQSVIGAALQGAVASNLHADQFSHESHAKIWAAVTSLQEDGAVPDTVTVADRLNRLFPHHGLLAYLTECVENTPTIAHVNHHADLVREAWAQRSAQAVALEMSKDPAADGAALAERFESAALELRRGLNQPETQRFTPASSLDTTPPEWLWYPFIPKGTISLCIGQPATGKTAMAIWLAAQVSTGNALPNFSGYPMPVASTEARVVAWYDAESSQGPFRRRLEAAGADLDMVHYASPDAGTTLDDITTIKADLAAMPSPPALVVFDTLAGFLPGKISLDSMGDTRRLLKPLAELAGDTGAAVLLLHHEGKGQRTSLLHAGVGSIGIMGAARSALVCGRHPENEGVFVMVHAKSSEEAPAQPVAYKLERQELGNRASTVKCVLDGVARGVDPLDVVNGPARESDGNRTAVDEACEFLLGFLEEGPELKTDIMRAAKKEGISEAAMRRAKDKLAVGSGRRQVDGVAWSKCPYEWYLSNHEQPSQPRIDAGPSMVAHGCSPGNTGGVLSNQQQETQTSLSASNDAACNGVTDEQPSCPHGHGYHHNGLCMACQKKPSCFQCLDKSTWPEGDPAGGDPGRAREDMQAAALEGIARLTDYAGGD